MTSNLIYSPDVSEVCIELWNQFYNKNFDLHSNNLYLRFEQQILEESKLFPKEISARDRVRAIAKNKACICGMCGVCHGNTRSRYCSHKCAKIARLNKKIKESHIKMTAENADTWIECQICKLRTTDLGTHYIFVHNLKRGHKRPTKAKILLGKWDGEKNPGWNHGGTMSPFSDKSLVHSEETRKVAREKAAKGASENTCWKPKYWMDKYDLTLAEAKEKVTWFQSRNLEWFVFYYGEEEGRMRWNRKTTNWVAVMDAKSIEEKAKINEKKCWRGGSVSKGEAALFENLMVTGAETQKAIHFNGKFFIVDYICGNKIIEYFGDYWHANPEIYAADTILKTQKKFAAEIWERDATRIAGLKSLGYEVLVVWDEYAKKNKNETIKKCQNFLAQ